MRRHLAGIISLVLLIVGGLLYFWPPDWENSAPLAASCIRIGAVLAAIWLAYPELKRIPGWLAPVCIIAVVAIAAKPKLAIFIIPVAIIILILRPRKKKQTHQQPRSARQHAQRADTAAGSSRRDRD